MENVYESYSETVYDRRYRIIERGCTTDHNPNLKQVRSITAVIREHYWNDLVAGEPVLCTTLVKSYQQETIT